MIFKLPIEYNNKTKPISKNIHHDINLLEKHNLYKYVFNPSTQIGKELLQKWNILYSYDVQFLQDSQKLYKTLDIKPVHNIDTIYKNWLEFKHQNNFLTTYNYVDWDILKWLNEHSLFLQLLSINTIISPILTILLPLVILLIPFILLKYQKINISFEKYYSILKLLLKRHPLGKLFSLQTVNIQEKAYGIATVGLFIVQIYQSVKSCITFYFNMNSIFTTIKQLKLFLQKTNVLLETFIAKSSLYSSYQLFNTQLIIEKEKITNIIKQLNTVNYSNIGEKFINMGSGLKQFYQLYNDNNVKETIDYAIQFNGYLDHISNLQKNISLGKLNACKFKKNKYQFKNAYYAPLDPKTAIKNSYNLKHNYVITGPNAAGKTTLLKTTLSNILISQQIGFGFYEKAIFYPYTYLHSYLNIPDTADRDSLFQAEARRCKEILDIIDFKKSSETIFCIFDELYSGTNPYEATASAESFLNYLSYKDNVSYMITTHYVDLCKKLENNKTKNYSMKINKKGSNIEYTYKLKKGISKIKGGIQVLEQLNYPKIIVNSTKDLLINSFSKY
tara:strand:- start:470 stop:2146 length:1677 start_codon:yes stop_codon:yes gene_type:complete